MDWTKTVAQVDSTFDFLKQEVEQLKRELGGVVTTNPTPWVDIGSNPGR